MSTRGPGREPDAWPPPNPECPTCGTNEGVYYRSLVPSHRWGCRGCATSFGAPPSTSASKPSDPCPMCDNEDSVPMFGCPDCGEEWLRSDDFDAWAKVRAASASEGDEDGFTVDGVTHAPDCMAIFRGARCSCGASEGDEAGVQVTTWIRCLNCWPDGADEPDPWPDCEVCHGHIQLPLEEAGEGGEALRRLEALKPHVHQRLDVVESYATLIEVFVSVQEAHLAISRSGLGVLGMSIAERVKLLIDAARHPTISPENESEET